MHTGTVCRQDNQKARQQTDRPTQHTEAAAHFAFSLTLHVRQHIKHHEQGSASESVEMGRPREPRPQGREAVSLSHNTCLENNKQEVTLRRNEASRAERKNKYCAPCSF